MRLQIIITPFLGWRGLSETSLSESQFSELWRLMLFLPRLASGLTRARDYKFIFFSNFISCLGFLWKHILALSGASRKQTPGKWQVHMERHHMGSFFPLTAREHRRSWKFLGLFKNSRPSVPTPRHQGWHWDEFQALQELYDCVSLGLWSRCGGGGGRETEPKLSSPSVELGHTPSDYAPVIHLLV